MKVVRISPLRHDALTVLSSFSYHEVLTAKR